MFCLDGMMNSSPPPYLSIIIPCYNSGATLPICLASLFDAAGQKFLDFEVIVVDDASADNTVAVARGFAVEVLHLPGHQGDSLTRNAGAKMAQGEILLFLDSDVEVLPGSLARAVEHFQQNSQLAALVGSYTLEAPRRSFAARYKNYLHHYTHQRAPERFPTFWTGFGLIRRAIFEDFQGFSGEFSPIDDIHLGMRLNQAGLLVMIDKELQVRHWKKLTLRSLFWLDLVGRAIPWTRIMLRMRRRTKGLNTGASQMASVVGAAGLLIGIMLLPCSRSQLVPMLLALLLPLFLALNLSFIRFLAKVAGLHFAGPATLLLWLSYLNQGLGGGLGLLLTIWPRSKKL
jgi:glycosyltransferase involved in cell wall biosynthesis